MRHQLAWLGIDATDDELSLHLQIPKLTICTAKETVLAAEAWLLRLSEANRRKARYADAAFREMLVARWLGVCLSACEHGAWTWERFNQSGINQLAPVAAKDRRRLRAMVLRARLRKGLPWLHKLLKR